MTKKTIPASALSFAADAEIGSNGSNAKSAPIKLLARTNTVTNYPGIGPILHDFTGCEHRNRIPLDWSHDSNTPIGFINKIDVSDSGIICSGSLVSTRPDDKCSDIIKQHEAGIPFEASILTQSNEVEFLDEGQFGMVNGEQVEGPLYVFRSYRLRGVALCLYGKDPYSQTEFSAGDSVELSVVPFNTNASSQKSGVTTGTIKDIAMSESVKAEAEKAVETPTVNDKSVEGADKPVDAEVKPGVEGGTEKLPVETPKTEGEKSVEVPKQTEVQELKLSDGQKFLEAFGQQGAVWFCEGKTYDQCIKLHIDSLKAENAELKMRLSQSAVGADAPVSFSASPDLSSEEQQMQAKTKKLKNEGVPDSIAQMMSLVGLPSEE